MRGRFLPGCRLRVNESDAVVRVEVNPPDAHAPRISDLIGPKQTEGETMAQLETGYAVEHQPVVLSGVTELLVHGVGGESARTRCTSRIHGRWPATRQPGSTADQM